MIMRTDGRLRSTILRLSLSKMGADVELLHVEAVLSQDLCGRPDDGY